MFTFGDLNEMKTRDHGPGAGARPPTSSWKRAWVYQPIARGFCTPDRVVAHPSTAVRIFLSSCHRQNT